MVMLSTYTIKQDERTETHLCGVEIIETIEKFDTGYNLVGDGKEFILPDSRLKIDVDDLFGKGKLNVTVLPRSTRAVETRKAKIGNLGFEAYMGTVYTCHQNESFCGVSLSSAGPKKGKANGTAKNVKKNPKGKDNSRNKVKKTPEPKSEDEVLDPSLIPNGSGFKKQERKRPELPGRKDKEPEIPNGTIDEPLDPLGGANGERDSLLDIFDGTEQGTGIAPFLMFKPVDAIYEWISNTRDDLTFYKDEAEILEPAKKQMTKIEPDKALARKIMGAQLSAVAPRATVNYVMKIDDHLGVVHIYTGKRLVKAHGNALSFDGSVCCLFDK